MKTGRIVLKKTKQQTMNQKSLECMKEFIQLLRPFLPHTQPQMWMLCQYSTKTACNEDLQQGK